MVMKALVEGFSEPVVAEDMTVEQWTDLRRQQASIKRMRGRSPCTCVDCGSPMHPKQNGLETRFFAHNPAEERPCDLRDATAGESEEHRRLKMAVYRAAKAVQGWECDVEVRDHSRHPVTRKPVVVDVVAKRNTARPRVDTGALQGFEVQLSTMSEGEALSRQEVRDRWLSRCTWITKHQPSWSGQLPWYRIHRADSDDVVVDGVVRWDEQRREYDREEPFPADAMVKYILRGARWVRDIGWELSYARNSKGRPARANLKRRDVRGVVADYCTRFGEAPEFTYRWTDVEWGRYALLALERRDRGEPLSDLDRLAITRCPMLDLASENANGGISGEVFDHLLDRFPCIICHDLVVVSVAVEFPVHHHCAWHIARGDFCFAPA
jgi:hypothetical protein